MSFFSHLGKQSGPYVIQMQVHDVQSIPSTEALHVLFQRGSKQYQSRVAIADGRQCRWDEVISFIATFYWKKGKNGVNVFDKKLYSVIVQSDGSKGPRLSISGKSGSSISSNRCHLTTEIDFAQFVQQPENVGKEITQNIIFFDSNKNKSSSAASSSTNNSSATNDSDNPVMSGPPMLKITFKIAPMKKGMEASALRKMGPQESFSMSAGSPLMGSSSVAQRESFSRQAQEELSPELVSKVLQTPNTPVPTVSEHGEHNEQHDEVSPLPSMAVEAASSRLAALGRTSKRNLYGDLEDAGLNGGNADRPSPHSGAKSYAVEDDVPAFPPKRESPSTSRPSPTPSPPAAGGDQGSDVPAAATESGKYSAAEIAALQPKKRRSETQIFTDIMVDAVNQPIVAATAAAAASVSATPSRKPSITSPKGTSRKVSLAASPTSVAHSHLPSPSPSAHSTPALKERSLHVSTSNTDLKRASSLASMTSETESHDGKPDNAAVAKLQSYTDLLDDSAPNSAAIQPSPSNALAQAALARGQTGGASAEHSSIINDEEADAGASESEESDEADTAGFADRHTELTVEDILSPGFAEKNAIHSTTSEATEGGLASTTHSKRISLFNKSDDTEVVSIEEMMGQRSTRGNSVVNAITKFSFFGRQESSKDVAKRISSTRNSVVGNLSAPSDGMPAPSPRSPAVTLNSSTSAGSSLTNSASVTAPAAVSSLSVTGANEPEPNTPARRKLMREPSFGGSMALDISKTSVSSHQSNASLSLDDMLDGANPILASDAAAAAAGASAVQTGGSAHHSRQHSRQHSRSNSPSRGSNQASASAPPVSSSTTTATGTSGPTLIVTPSPRGMSAGGFATGAGSLSKPAFPHTSPAKHSAAHRATMSLTSASGSSPFSSLSKEEREKLANMNLSGMSPPPIANVDANGAELGSYAAWKAGMQAKKKRGASSGAIALSTPGAVGGTMQITPHSASARLNIPSASKTLPRSSSSGVPPTAPRSGSSSLKKDEAAALTNANLNNHRLLAAPNSTPIPAVSVGGASGNSPSVSPAVSATPSPSISAHPSPATNTTSLLSYPASAAAALGTAAGASVSDSEKLESSFRERNESNVSILCETLSIPDLVYDAEEVVGASPPAPAVPSSSNNASSAPAKDTPTKATDKAANAAKNIWNSLTQKLSSKDKEPSPPAVASTSSPTSPAASNRSGTGATASATTSPSSRNNTTVKENPAHSSMAVEARFFQRIPIWSLVTLRCLNNWDVFSVPPLRDDTSGEIVRRAPRSWMLSAVLLHLNRTSTFLCARSSAGQRQDALTFFIATLASTIQLVEAYAKSDKAPPPFPLTEDAETSAQNAAERGNRTASGSPVPIDPSALASSAQNVSMTSPQFPRDFASWRGAGCAVIAQLPMESSARVCEDARNRLRSSRSQSNGNNYANGATNSAQNQSFPYSVSLNTSIYHWFLAHLRLMLRQSYQCLLEVVLTELEIVDAASLLSEASESDDMAEVGFEPALQQLSNSFQKIHDDMCRQHVPTPLVCHFFRCLFRNLCGVLFNAVLSSRKLMSMQTGMRLQVFVKFMQDWTSNQQEEYHLQSIAQEELARVHQLAMLLLTPKSGITLEGLAELCPALTPLALYHLLLNYASPTADNAGAPSPGSEEGYVNESLLEELTDYQTFFLSKLGRPTPTASSTSASSNNARPGHRRGESSVSHTYKVLFPSWKVHALVDGSLKSAASEHDDDEDEDDVYARRDSVELNSAQIQSPFIDVYEAIPLPVLKAKSTASSDVAAIQLASVPVPERLTEEKGFMFLHSNDPLTLSIVAGAANTL